MAKVKRPTLGPKGLKFYSPGKLPKGPHGTLIWERPMAGGQSLTGARNYLVDYTQVGVKGRLVPVSGMVAIPRGTAPKGGWPVITWAHGTTGIADLCAPSQLPARNGGLNNPMLDSWIKAGYAVVRTDYEGLGGPAGVGDTVTEHTYAGATHSTVLTAAQSDQAAFLKKRLGG